MKLVYVEYCGERIPRQCNTITLYTSSGIRICTFSAIQNQCINHAGSVQLMDGHLKIQLRDDDE